MKPILVLTGGWLIWAAGFAAIYALHGLGCAIGADRQALGPVTLIQAMMGAAWLASILAVLVALPLLRRLPDPLPGEVPRGIVLGGWMAALAAMLVTGLPILFPSACL